ncbi:36079_t:CDS:2, partial [Racocetra persica]
DQTSYLEIPEDESLFLPAERPIHPKPIVNMPILRKKSTRMKTTDLIDLEEGKSTKDPDVEMEEVHEDHESQELQDPITQNQDQDQDESAKLLEKIILYDEGPVAGEVEDDQRKQLLELLRENPDLCVQDISELGRTDIIRYCIPTQDI